MLNCPRCNAEILDAPILASVAAHFTGFPTPLALLDYIKRNHADWPRLYRTCTEPDGRRRVRRFVLASECAALVQETFRHEVKRPRRGPTAEADRSAAGAGAQAS